MASWLSAWLPSIPSIDFSFSNAIQRRFISFILKKSLGHFLKPGQLDVHQVDSQIGAGHVQVNDLELDNQAINQLLTDLPLELHVGSIGSVVARIPFPNPLTSTIGFSVRSLHLTFHLVPSASNTDRTNAVDLSDSVASMAESFVHDELTPREEASLRESIYTETVGKDEHNVPGGLDPFLTDPDDATFQSDFDPAGVSVFAVLIERFLARFECDASDLKFTIVSPGQSYISLSVGEVSYAMESTIKQDGPSDAPVGSTRKVEINDIKVTMGDLRPTPSPWDAQSRSGESSFHAHAKRASPASSSSSLDEDTELMMSQSIACLPQRPISPASSVSSSMYQSALSTDFARDQGNFNDMETTSPPTPNATRVPDSPSHASPHQSPKGTANVNPMAEEIIFSISNEPIIIRLTTPFVAPPSVQSDSSDTMSRPALPKPLKESLELTMNAGVIAGALRARHIRALLDTLERWNLYHIPKQTTSSKSPSPSDPTLALSFNVLVKVKGIVLLALPAINPIVQSEESPLALRNFYAHPLLPPRLPNPFLRLYIEDVRGSLPSFMLQPVRSRTSSSREAATVAIVSISDISIFTVHPPRDSDEIVASPILVTDPHLPSQHSPLPQPPHSSDDFEEVPNFPVIDYTDEAHWRHGVRPSFWRTKSKKKGRPPSADNASQAQGISEEASEPSVSPSSPAVQLHLSQIDHAQSVDVTVTPLHIFLDLGQALRPDGLMAFIDEVSQPQFIAPERSIIPDEESEESDTTPPATPRFPSHGTNTARRRQRIEKAVLDDLDLDLDYRAPKVADRRGSLPNRSRKRKRPPSTSGNQFTVKFSMIRIQMRCPSPLRFPQRSGALVLDLYRFKLCSGTGESSNATPRFVIPGESDRGSTINALLSVDLGGLSVALSAVGSPKSTVLFSTTNVVPEGSLSSPGASSSGPRGRSTTQCRLVVLKPVTTKGQANTTSLAGELTSIRVILEKGLLDGVQYWADDISQLLESFGSSQSNDSGSDTESRDASLIGSRFFVKSRSASTMGSGLTVGHEKPQQSETAMRFILSQVHITILLPRHANSAIRPLIIQASDVDVLLELKPEGKDQTVLTLGVADAAITDFPAPGRSQKFLALTNPRAVQTSTPLVKLRFTSLVIPGTTSKETRIHLTLSGFTYTVFPNFDWIEDITSFTKAPPGAFESVIPSERTKVTVKVNDGSVKALAPNYPGAILLYIGDLTFSTVVGEPSRSSYKLSSSDVSVLVIDNLTNVSEDTFAIAKGAVFWRSFGYALMTEIRFLDMDVLSADVEGAANVRVTVERVGIRIHLCADTATALSAFITDLVALFIPPGERPPKPKRQPTVVSEQTTGLSSSILIDETFKVNPELMGPSMDMISDDLPSNPYYLDEHFGSAAGLRELRDDDLDDFEDDTRDIDTSDDLPQTSATSHVGSETIKILNVQGLNFVDNYFDDLPAIPEDGDIDRGPTTLQVRVEDGEVTLLLYDGYDWERTRRIIEDEVKEMRRRLAKIRQLVATGHLPDESVEETSALLFNSMYIGLERDAGELDSGALIAAIDEELKEDSETTSQGSWESLMPPMTSKPQVRTMRVHGKKLTRSKRPRIEICLMGLYAEVDKYKPDDSTVSRIFVTVKDLEILDHIKTSTWRKFLTGMKVDSRGIVRETGSNMARIELLTVRPVPGNPSEEARLKAKILPLRLYVDQDALDFLKKFFSFKDPEAESTNNSSDESEEIFFQHAEVFPVDLKLDYKPRRVDYRALREGKTIELMNFFHFDGAEMTLRHITLSGITGWPRFFDMLNDLWTPDVKATQLMDVISGVSPIRSVVNVGSGVADLVLLPIAQYKKDGRVVRGIQRGANSFVKSTAIEAIKLGARLATGTQVILEQAEGVMGGQFDQAITTEALQPPNWEDELPTVMDEDEAADLISKYADQPSDIKEGVQTAYQSLRKNLNSAAQTILAVPMEVYERSGNEGPVRAVIRAVPIAVLKPMIGASEAISKTLMGLHNTLDPNIRHENEEKYKQR